MRNRATLHDVTAIGGPRMMSSCFFGHVQKPGCDFQDCRVSYDHRATSYVKQRCATSRLIVRHFHLFSPEKFN